MKRIIIILFVSLCVAPAFAQSSDYAEMAKEVDQEVWGDKDPILDNNKLPAIYKNESAVILARKQTVETNTERKGKSLLYIGKMHSTIKRTFRERIFINDQVSLNAYSEINFNQLQSRQNAALTRNLNYTFMGIRVTKADGSVQKINVDEAAVKLGETKDGKKNKIAVPNLAIGDVIDYYVTYFDQARTDKSLDYVSFVLGEEYPIMNLNVKVVLDKRVAAQYQVINGAPDFKISTTEDDDNVLQLSASNLPKSSNVMWISENRQVPIVRLKFAFADIQHGIGDYTKAGKIEKMTSPVDVEHQLVNLIKPFLAQLTVEGNIKGEWKDYAKEHDIDKDNVDSIVRFVYHSQRNSTFGGLIRNYSEDTKFERFYDCSMSLNGLKQLELILKTMKAMNAYFDIPAELVLVSDRNDVAYNDVFTISDFNYLLRVPVTGSKHVFYYFGSNLYNFSEIPPSFENETYKFIQQNSIYKRGKDMSQEKADRVNGKDVTFKSSAADNNQTEDLLIAFDNSNMQLLNIKRKARALGHQRRYLQNSTLILEDYWKAERKVLGKEVDMDKEWKAYRKLRDEAEQSMAKAKKEQKDKLEKEIMEQYDSKPKELLNYKIMRSGFDGPKATVAVEEEFSMDGWVKKAGNNYILEAGKFVGGQLEVKTEQRERKLDVYMPFARSYNHNVVLKIPEGYTVEGVEKFNKSVKNECGGFESTAKLEGDNLTITYHKYYNNAVEPAANWTKILAFVDAGFDFTKEKLLLKKK